MKCEQLFYSRHALERMFQRSILPDTIRSIIVQDNRIAFYPEDKPYPSTLLLGFERKEPVHILVARDDATGDCIVITVYRPEPSIWSEDYKTRRKA